MHQLATRGSTPRLLPAWILYIAIFLLALLTILAHWACNLGSEDGKDTFDVVGEDAWTECDEVFVILLDGDGAVVDTLFRGALTSLDQLKRLDAGKYQGGKGVVHIRGTKDGGLCFEQKRSFDPQSESVKVDTLSDPTVSPVSLAFDPESLVISMGSPDTGLTVNPSPAYADRSMIWSLDTSDVVALEGLASGRGNPVRVKPLKAGLGVIQVRSAKDTSVSRRVKVRVVPVTLGGIKIGTVNDTVRLYERGSAESLKVEVPAEYRDQRIEWRTGNKSVAEVDAAGRIRPVKAGQTHVQATLLPSGLSDVAVVRVKLDAPLLTVESRRGAPVGVDIVFSAKAVQEFGTLKVFKWDLDGDGGWDDSSDVADTGRAVHLPAKKARYDKEGPVTAGFLVRDSEGNEAKTEVLLDIGNQAPEITDLRLDTVISIKDEIPMGATVRDQNGTVAWVGWDYEGNGRFDDTLAVSDSVVKFSRGHRFVEAGTYIAVIRAVDANGKARQDTSRVKVEFDAPVADAGPDFTVSAGEPITLSAKGTDKFGSIARRAIRCGSDTDFTYLSAQDTTFPAPRQPGILKCAVRVTDDDGLSDKDEVEITVVLSSNADLIDLKLSAGVLAPSFRPNTPEYEGRVIFTDSVVTLTPTAKDGSAEILVNGKRVASGSPSQSLKLPVRRTTDAFVILVTAADGSQRKYAVHLTRDPNGEATLARLEAPGLALSPAFAPGTVDYSDTVLFDMSTATFKAAVASAGATLSFGDSTMTSGTFTAPQFLEFGENVFRFTVTAMDGESRTTYTVKVFRLGRLITFRKLGGASAAAQDTIDM
ncbi:MAG TPA: cadherin-like beta sandwich domain-containing protein, partial [Fibrobacteria bacterium]|nr:cadherin-like beta sandwich domain-containing protein [Fibrobacteria bacterium]